MNERPLHSEHVALLRQRHLGPPFPNDAVDDLVAVLRHVRLDPGEVLIRQGDTGDDLFLVIAGQVDVEVQHPDGTKTVVDTIGDGGVVGELALLTGQPRNATVVARAATDAARLSRTDFERVASRHPKALNVFLRRVLPRMRRTQLVRVLTELFGDLEPAAIADLEAELVWTELTGGATLFREGDRGEDVYIVVNGRLRVAMADPNAPGGQRVVEEAGRGRAVGELALLTGETRAATVTAVRDSDLLRLSRAAFDRLLDRHPRAMLQIARAAAWRLRQGAARARRASASPSTFALVPAGPGAPHAVLAQRFAAALGEPGTVLCLGSGDVDRMLGRAGIAQTTHDDAIHESIVAWLSEQEREHRYLVLVADGGDTEWTQRCVRHADRVLIVGRAGDDPARGALEAALEPMGLTARCELVLVHPDSALRPSGTAAWLEARNVAAHHHVRLGDDAQLRRLARRASGRATALVLGGGGARGFSHIGALRALAEGNVEIDMIGGTSIGSAIAGAYAVGLSPDEIVGLAEAFASKSKIMDRTLPIVALMEGRKLTGIYQGVYGDALIEDLWIPYFAVSSGLARAEAVVHERGPLWRAVRSSTAVPGIFPPMIAEDREVLVDGNVMNNMPLDVMRERCESGTLIGLNPMPSELPMRRYNCGPSVSGWQALLGRLKLFGIKLRAPSIFGSIMRATEINSANRMRQPSFRALADLLIEPPVGAYAIMGYGAYAPIIEIGYEAARSALAAWAAQRMPGSGEAGDSWRPEHESNVRPAP